MLDLLKINQCSVFSVQYTFLGNLSEWIRVVLKLIISLDEALPWVLSICGLILHRVTLLQQRYERGACERALNSYGVISTQACKEPISH